jgi:hypothetical protein
MKTKQLPGGVIVGIVAAGALAFLVILFVIFAPQNVTQKTTTSLVRTGPVCMCGCTVNHLNSDYQACPQPWDTTGISPQCPDADYPPGYVPTVDDEEITDLATCRQQNGQGCRGYIYGTGNPDDLTRRFEGTLRNCKIYQVPVPAGAVIDAGGGGDF